MSPRPLGVGSGYIDGYKVTKDSLSELKAQLRFQRMLVNESGPLARQVIQRRFKSSEVAYLVILQRPQDDERPNFPYDDRVRGEAAAL